MTTNLAPTLTHTELIQLRCAATDHTGYHGVEVLDIAVAVEWLPTDPSDPQHIDSDAVRLREWLDQYVAGRDLTHALDFAPTARNLAMYWLRCFLQLSPQVCAVTVTTSGQQVRAALQSPRA